jgi:hypothetical protein
MRIIGCDLHARQQTLAMLDTTTGEAVNLTLQHEGNPGAGILFQSPAARAGHRGGGSIPWFPPSLSSGCETAPN